MPGFLSVTPVMLHGREIISPRATSISAMSAASMMPLSPFLLTVFMRNRILSLRENHIPEKSILYPEFYPKAADLCRCSSVRPHFSPLLYRKTIKGSTPVGRNFSFSANAADFLVVSLPGIWYDI